jgi:hypothetical protein
MWRHRGPGSSRFRAEAGWGRGRVWRARSGVGVWLAAVGCVAQLACGGRSAAAPDPVGLSLAPGPQVLTLAGFTVSLDPEFPPCTPALQPAAGLSVNTFVVLVKEGGEWVARSTAPQESIELRFRAAGSSSGGYGYRVTGTISGSAVDVALTGVVRDIRVSLGSAAGGAGAAVFDGETATPTTSLIVGRVSGALRFSDSRGQSSTCSAIRWTMQPY